MRMQERYKGIACIVIATVIFGMMPLFAKKIYENGGNPISLVFYRAFISTPVLFLLNKRKNIVLKISKKQFIEMTILAIVGYSATAILLYLSYNYISTGLATTIHFTYPIIVTLACTIIYKEKLSFSKIFAVILSTVGIFLFVNNIGDINYLGVVIAFLSGVTFAFYMVFFDKSGLCLMHSLKSTFYLSAITSVVVLIFSLATKTFTINMTLYGWILTIVFSFMITIVAVTLFQRGVTLIGAQSAAVISTLEPITSIIIGILIFNEIFNFRIFLGGILILSAVIISALAGNKVKLKNEYDNN